MTDDTSPPRRGSVTDWISLVVAAIALFVSWLSWNESRNANQEAQKANRETQKANSETQRLGKREQATKVDFILERKSDGEVLSIANRSPSLIQDVSLTFADGSYIDVEAVASCTIWWVSPLTVTNSRGEAVTLQKPIRLDFTDAQDPPGRWTIMGAGLKSQASEPNKERDVKGDFGAQINFSRLEQCG
ncbi:hypothetical protein ABT144_30095 [Streptomyces sp. NPDC002039]|uniref:hypothetical protein n=1 Tax=Streptomyces sp. NPDC002039 TaxID=3154660 RepID=UPI003325CD27